MAKKKRKIGFYYISVIGDGFDLHKSYLDTLAHIGNLTGVERRRNIIGNKFGYLDSIKSFDTNTRHQLIFKSATNKFRPPLLDVNTIKERMNPKTIHEGESHKTHLISKMINGDLILIVENYRDGLTIKQIIKYLNSFTENFSNPFYFHVEMIIKDNFLEEVNSMKRVVGAEIYVDKQLLGSESLNYSERINPVKHEVVIAVKAKNMDNIADFARDVYSRFTGGKQEIKRIRLKGKSDDNNLVVINTDRIERQEFVDSEVNQNTGELISDQLFREMNIIMYNF